MAKKKSAPYQSAASLNFLAQDIKALRVEIDKLNELKAEAQRVWGRKRACRKSKTALLWGKGGNSRILDTDE